MTLPAFKLAEANVKIHKTHKRVGVETDLHGGTNQDPSKQMRMTDEQLQRMSRNQQTVKVNLREVLLALSYLRR